MTAPDLARSLEEGFDRAREALAAAWQDPDSEACWCAACTVETVRAVVMDDGELDDDDL